MQVRIVKKFRFHFKRIWNPDDDSHYRNIALGFLRIFYDLPSFNLEFEYHSEYGLCYHCNKNKRRVVEFNGDYNGYQICRKCFKKLSKKDLNDNE